MTIKNQNSFLRAAFYHDALTSTNWTAGNRDLTKQLKKMNSANNFGSEGKEKICETSLHTQSAPMSKWESDAQSEKLSQLRSEKNFIKPCIKISQSAIGNDLEPLLNGAVEVARGIYLLFWDIRTSRRFFRCFGWSHLLNIKKNVWVTLKHHEGCML